MKSKKNIIIVITSIFVLAIGINSCARPVVVENDQNVKVHSVIYKDRPLGKWTDCRVCKGKGSCIYCKGTAKLNGKECKNCKGTGRCVTCEGQGGFRAEE